MEPVFPPAGGALPPIKDLMRESWSSYRRQFWPLTAVAGLGGAMTLLGGFIPVGCVLIAWVFLGRPSPPVWIAAIAAALFAALWAASWTQAALLETVLQESGPYEAIGIYRRSWKKVGAFSWVCFAAFLAAAGGIYLFIAPGIFLFFALSFAPLISIAEGLGGIRALEKSLAYVRGKWFGVFGRLVFISVFCWILSKIPFIGIILGLLSVPFALIFTTTLYLKLRLNAEPEPFPRGRLLLSACWAGLLIPCLLAFRLAALWPQVYAEIRQEASTFAPNFPGLPGLAP